VPFEHPVSARRVLTFNKEGATDESLLEGRLPPPESLRSFLVSPKDRPRFLAHRGFFRKYRDAQPRGVVKGLSGEWWEWSSSQPSLPTVRPTASLRLLLGCDLQRSKPTTRRSRVRVLLQHIADRIFRTFGHKQFEFCHCLQFPLRWNYSPVLRLAFGGLCSVSRVESSSVGQRHPANRGFESMINGSPVV
jgi:hypothetical protein